MNQNLDEKNPFENGVWILLVLGGCDVVARVEEETSREQLVNELMSSKCICVTLKRRYVLKQLQFPMPEMDARGKHTGNWQTGAIATIGKHEITMDLMYEFPVLACVNNFAFINDLHHEDIDRLRRSVNAADLSAEMTIRATKANILMPNKNPL